MAIVPVAAGEAGFTGLVEALDELMSEWHFSRSFAYEKTLVLML